MVLRKILGVFVLLACGATTVMAQTTIRVAYPLVRNSTYGEGVEVFGTTLTQLTNGRYKVEHLSGKGDELDNLNKVKAGELEMANTSTGPLGALVPEVKILDLPFLFTGYAHARTVLDGPIGTKLLDTLPNYGLQGLAWAENGFRHVTNNKRPIVYPADLTDLKLRTMQNAVHMESLKSMKAAPTPLAFNKLMAALKSGELDGQENPLPVILSGKLYESQKYLSLTQHFYSAGIFTISPKLWKSLSDADKKAFKEAAKAGAKAQRQRVSMDEIAALSKLTDAGMKVNSHVDMTAFRLVLRPRYTQFLPGANAALIEQIQTAY